MKFLILSLCVCAASAASLSLFNPTLQISPSKPTKTIATPARTAARIVASPAVAAAKVAGKTIFAAAKVVATPEVAAAEVSAAPAVADAKVAAPVPTSAVPDARAAIIRDQSDVRPDGYKYSYKTENGISAKSNGTLKKVDDVDVLVVAGSYKYVAPDGTPIKVKYVANENGYQPQSNILPVGPPTPEIILRALEYIASQPKWVDPTVKEE